MCGLHRACIMWRPFRRPLAQILLRNVVSESLTGTNRGMGVDAHSTHSTEESHKNAGVDRRGRAEPEGEGEVVKRSGHEIEIEVAPMMADMF